jgi:hypothetical protein
MVVYIVVKPPNLRDLAAWRCENTEFDQALVASRPRKV